MNFKDIAVAKAARACGVVFYCLLGVGIFAGTLSSAYAFRSHAHAQITISAFKHLKTYPHAYEATGLWLVKGGVNQNQKDQPSFSLLEELMLRTDVDADYRYDIWIGGWYHDPFVGGYQGGSQFTIFTSMMHFLNITKPGDYWEYDGYSYKNSTKKGIDSYLDTTSASIRGEVSEALGGHHLEHSLHGTNPGPYIQGFTGTEEDWQKMFFGDNAARNVIFPPANIPAQMAFDALIRSPRTKNTFSDTWNEKLPFVTGFYSTTLVTRHNWRAEIKDLPKDLDLLGISLHMAQDMEIPQHTQGTGENCHQELEDLVDELSCPASIKIDNWKYNVGQYGSDYPSCQNLYDPILVERFLAEIPALNRKSLISISNRIKWLALLSNRWSWKETKNEMTTELPDGSTYSAKTCTDLMKIKAVRGQAKIQYNLAVAATVALFEQAAEQYEITYPLQKAILGLFHGPLVRLE